ncbi:MAG: hypothetical protein NTX53_05715 [candidate division WOR-3 bacterium]|nr:hypothetical protein [candidate division WOR-3 bacterium]
MNDDSKLCRDELRDEYEPPQAIHLNDSDRAYGACSPSGSTPGVCATGSGGTDVGYRVYGFEGICVTGKSATGGCYAGA